MTASRLLLFVTLALVLQLGVLIAVAFRRRRHVEAEPRPAPTALGAWAGWRDFRVVRRAFEDRAGTVCSFHLAPVDGVPLPPFVSGQFLTLAVPVANDRPLVRCYSLSGEPAAESYRISVKRVLAPAGRPGLPPGAASHFLHDRVHVGDVVRAKAPAGRFVVDGDPAVPLVLLAGGIGLTPLLSMLRGALAARPDRAVRLYYGVRSVAERCFRDELDALSLRHPSLHTTLVSNEPALAGASGSDDALTGNIDVDLLRRTLPAGRHRFYVCGPPPMMASLLPALAAWGVLPGDVHHEAFGPASAPGPSSHAATSHDIRFRRSARTLAWDGTDANLLDFAERHGLAVESGCRTGSCGTCEVVLVAGTVHYADKPEHDVAPGRCLLCVGVPESDLEVEA